jgi:hypothetical protein
MQIVVQPGHEKPKNRTEPKNRKPNRKNRSRTKKPKPKTSVPVRVLIPGNRIKTEVLSVPYLGKPNEPNRTEIHDGKLKTG